jgi:hypothetical protein
VSKGGMAEECGLGNIVKEGNMAWSRHYLEFGCGDWENHEEPQSG